MAPDGDEPFENPESNSLQLIIYKMALKVCQMPINIFLFLPALGWVIPLSTITFLLLTGKNKNPYVIIL
jgi:hypothetical protein